MSVLTRAQAVRHIGDKVDSGQMADNESYGRVATFSRSTLKLNSIAALYPLCRGRFSSIARTVEAMYVKDKEISVDKVMISLTAEKKIVSATPVSLDTYVIKGLAVPVKKVVTGLISQSATSMLSTMSVFLTSSVSSILGFSINMGLAFRDLKKSGGSPTYIAYVYSFYIVQLFVLILTAYITWSLFGGRYVTYAVLLMVAFFFLVNTIVTGLYKIYDRRIADKIDNYVAENMYNQIRKNLLESVD